MPEPVGRPIERIFEAISAYSQNMVALHKDFLGIVQSNNKRDEELMDNLCNEMHWQAGTVLAITTMSAFLETMSAFMPKAPKELPTAAAPENPRLGANAGISDAFSGAWKLISNKHSDGTLRKMCSAGSKLLSGASRPAEVWFQSKTTPIEAKRQIVQLNRQEGQGGKGACDNSVRQAYESALAIMQSKAKGG